MDLPVYFSPGGRVGGRTGAGAAIAFMLANAAPECAVDAVVPVTILRRTHSSLDAPTPYSAYFNHQPLLAAA